MARGTMLFWGSAILRQALQRLRRPLGAVSSALVFALTAVLPASAQEAAPFYRGKTIRIVISTGVAGGYAEYARLLADHMGAHIAGQPGFIVQSMPGAGGLLAANYLYSQAPQDGEEVLDLVRRQDGRRLVEDQQARVTVEQAQDLQALALADR